jgi:hypothetical protein
MWYEAASSAKFQKMKYIPLYTFYKKRLDDHQWVEIFQPAYLASRVEIGENTCIKTWPLLYWRSHQREDHTTGGGGMGAGIWLDALLHPPGSICDPHQQYPLLRRGSGRHIPCVSSSFFRSWLLPTRVA